MPWWITCGKTVLCKKDSLQLQAKIVFASDVEGVLADRLYEFWRITICYQWYRKGSKALKIS